MYMFSIILHFFRKMFDCQRNMYTFVCICVCITIDPISKKNTFNKYFQFEDFSLFSFFYFLFSLLNFSLMYFECPERMRVYRRLLTKLVTAYDSCTLNMAHFLVTLNMFFNVFRQQVLTLTKSVLKNQGHSIRAFSCSFSYVQFFYLNMILMIGLIKTYIFVFEDNPLGVTPRGSITKKKLQANP